MLSEQTLAPLRRPGAARSGGRGGRPGSARVEAGGQSAEAKAARPPLRAPPDAQFGYASRGPTGPGAGLAAEPGTLAAGLGPWGAGPR